MHTKTQIADDLSVHIATVRIAGETYIEVRQFIPSLKQYGRGVTIPATHEAMRGVSDGIKLAIADVEGVDIR